RSCSTGPPLGVDAWPSRRAPASASNRGSSATSSSCRSRGAASPPDSGVRGPARSTGPGSPPVAELGRDRYLALYGPTTGDRIRLADTDLWIEVEEDRCGGPASPLAGDEAVFGGGKVIRESMGQARTTRAEGALDLVITGAVVLDHWGIVKADVGIR